MKTIDNIARLVHTALSEWSEINGQPPYPKWEAAPHWMHEKTIKSVKFVLDSPNLTAKDMHDHWSETRLSEGWRFGLTKDPIEKTHPMLIPYEDLPEFEKRKDALVISIARAMTEGL